MKDWVYLTPGFTKELQWLNQCSICERLDRKIRSTEQIREPRNRPTQKQSTDLWQRAKATQWKGQTLQQMVLEQLDIDIQKKKNKESRPYSVTGTLITAHRNAKCHSHYATPASNFVQSLT